MSDGGKPRDGDGKGGRGKAAKSAAREDRLADALRANLRRRKAQASARDGDAGQTAESPKDG